MTDPDVQMRLELMAVLQTEARSITVPLYAGGMVVENKAASGFDPVTNADRDAEAVLRRIIRDAFPDDAIEGEEFEDVPGTSGWLWTLDPIDGTRAFVAGVPVWSTLIAVSRHDLPVLGLIDLPALERSYWGGPDGSWREDERGKTLISTRRRKALSACILGCTEPLAMFRPGERAAYEMIRRGVAFSRLGLDALGHGLVAEGRMDIVIEALMKPCDVRALVPVVEGAGGKLVNWEGSSAVNGGRIVTVGDARRLDEVLEYLGRAMD